MEFNKAREILMMFPNSQSHTSLFTFLPIPMASTSLPKIAIRRDKKESNMVRNQDIVPIDTITRLSLSHTHLISLVRFTSHLQKLPLDHKWLRTFTLPDPDAAGQRLPVTAREIKITTNLGGPC